MDKQSKVGRVLLQLVAVGIGAIFIYAGVMKALDPAQFAKEIGNFRILPPLAGTVLALYLPWLEMFCGTGLAFRRLYRGSLSILLALTVVFIVALISAKVRGIDISCSCFGAKANDAPIIHAILRDIPILCGLAILAIADFVQRRRSGAPAIFRP